MSSSNLLLKQPLHNYICAKDVIAYLFLFGVLISLNQLNTPLFSIIVKTLSDAFIGVSVFVGASLALYYTLEQYFDGDLMAVVNRKQWLQVPIAALMGALPGCGGAIIVVTQFVQGRFSFGSFVAVLISTMGDASFLLLSQRPKIALLVFVLSLIAGTLFGYLVDLIHRDGFYCKPQTDAPTVAKSSYSALIDKAVKPFIGILSVGLFLGILQAFQIDPNSVFGDYSQYKPATMLGFVGAMMCIMFWINRPLPTWSGARTCEDKQPIDWSSVVAETSFVSVWVIVGFLLFELTIYFFQLDLKSIFGSLGAFLPLAALAVGFIPGCGPQILVTSLYLSGAVPLSAQISNAISNDGDALFPALALAPKAAMLATLYSAIPALILGYLFYFAGY
ncbi:MAG: arsenic efflux protein [Psychrobium sp.]|nr:arsenic efflux protein [Psychrobium sp.]